MKKEKSSVTWGVITRDGMLVGSFDNRQQAREYRTKKVEKIVRIEVSGKQVTAKFVR